MTNKLKEHVIRCGKAMQFAKPILGAHAIPDDCRTVTVVGLISVLIEHQESVLLLVIHEQAGSASALVRPIVEAAYRALWINLPATDEEVKKFNEKDKIDPEFGEIAAALDKAYGTGDFFQDFKTRTWKHLNSYTHGGMHQIGRRFLKHEVANNYSEEEIYEMTTTVTTVVLLAISLLLKRHGHKDSGDRVQALLQTYGPLADGTKPMTKDPQEVAQFSFLRGSQDRNKSRESGVGSRPQQTRTAALSTCPKGKTLGSRKWQPTGNRHPMSCRPRRGRTIAGEVVNPAGVAEYRGCGNADP